jgi:hypothetical protein
MQFKIQTIENNEAVEIMSTTDPVIKVTTSNTIDSDIFSRVLLNLAELQRKAQLNGNSKSEESSNILTFQQGQKRRVNQRPAARAGKAGD